MLNRSRPSGRLFGTSGYTLLEILIVVSIIFILAAMAQPMAHGISQRAKEVELKYKLRSMRRAIDQFKRDWDREGDKRFGELCQLSQLSCSEISGDYGYPRTLEDMMEVRYMIGADEKVKRYLRQIPVDPMTETAEWGLRCYTDDPEEDSWCGDDVFDVYSLSHELAMDGSYYGEW